MELYRHQQDLVDKDPDRRGLGFGCGAGKTRTVLMLANKKEGKVLVVAPKTQVQDRTWEREAEKIGQVRDMTVMSKEAFKKGAPDADILVLDECHNFLGVTTQTRFRNKVEVPKASELFEKMLEYVQKVRPRCVYLCSATPFPQPLALWAAARLFGEEWDYFAFRRKFYHFVPTIGRGVWLAKRDKEHQQLLVMYAQKFFTFGRLEDFFDVPEQVYKDVNVGDTPAMRKSGKELPLLYPERLVQIGKRHQLEQGIFEGGILDENKAAEVIELAKEFGKLLVFARYTRQVDSLATELKKRFPKRDVLVLDGRTADRRTLMEKAEDKDRETIVIAQSQVSTGYELPSFRCTVFASCDYSFVNYEQAKGRTQRANAISRNVYVHLIAGKVDEAVLKRVREKQDFNEALYLEETGGKV